MTRRWFLRVAASAIALCHLGLLPARAEQDCEVPPEMMQVTAKLPHLAARLRAHEPVNIVAIGGASTTGTAAGSPELAYPHRLQLVAGPPEGGGPAFAA